VSVQPEDAGLGTAARASREQAKVKRQKRIVAIGSVVLLAVVGYQLPKLMGENTVQTTSPPPAAVAPAPGSSAGAATLPDTDRVVTQADGQLLSFGLFKSKDPFVQQLSTVPVAAPAGSGGTPTAPASTVPTPQPPSAPPSNGGIVAGATTSTTTAGVEPGVGTAASTPPAVPPAATAPTPTLTVPAPAAPAPAQTPAQTVPATISPAATTPAVTPPAPAPTVAIATNGICERVPLKGTFPATQDIFRVTAIATGGATAKVGVVGGSYDNGKAVASLERGKKLTLVNTADGSRYVLELLRSCDVETTPLPTTTSSSAATTTTASTPPPVVQQPTRTTTTPIVPDSKDPPNVVNSVTTD
jgi:hypothetical protein